jgi:hypothetical protein
VRALLLRSPCLQQLNVDSCHRLSANCCPDSFNMAGHDLFSSRRSSSGNGSSSRRPSKLIRVKQHAAEDTAAAAAVAAADAADVAAVQEKVAAVAGGLVEFSGEDGYGSGELIGTSVATPAEEMQLQAAGMLGSGASYSSQAEIGSMSLSADQSQGQGHSSGSGSSSGSSVGYLELSALQRALDQP